MGARFSLEESRRYWRLAPSGAGKHDTDKLASASDRALAEEWLAGFTKRFGTYLEEDLFLQQLARDFRGKRVLSVGSGLGLHEIFYACNGARMTCCDIVETNLAVIERMSTLLGAGVETFVLREDSALGEGYDVVFIYGSLMTMPEPQQRALLDRCIAALAPGGSIVLMLYTWAFARDTCGWTNPDEFDPLVFARASDESVGAEHCPWSDWHDDAKLLALTPGWTVARRQFWQQAWFVWFELKRDTVGEPALFFDPLAAVHAPKVSVRLDAMTPAAAILEASGAGLRCQTEATQASYAALSEPFSAPGTNALVLEAEIATGAFSVGVLDAAGERFLASFPVRMQARATHLFAIEPSDYPVRIVLSNFRDAPSVSDFSVFAIELAYCTRASMTFAAEVRRRLGIT